MFLFMKEDMFLTKYVCTLHILCFDVCQRKSHPNVMWPENKHSNLPHKLSLFLHKVHDNITDIGY